jgi:hypothetical protein
MHAQRAGGRQAVAGRARGASGRAAPRRAAPRAVASGRAAGAAGGAASRPPPPPDLPPGLLELSPAEAALADKPVGSLSSLDLPFEANAGGVETATERYDLPPPSVAVRNMVEQGRYCHLCTTMSHMQRR